MRYFIKSFLSLLGSSKETFEDQEPTHPSELAVEQQALQFEASGMIKSAHKGFTKALGAEFACFNFV